MFILLAGDLQVESSLIWPREALEEPRRLRKLIADARKALKELA
jgi:hypothetical protein